MNWEYKTVHFDKRQFLTGRIDPKRVSEELNKQGAQGWELVSTMRDSWGPNSPLVAVFKRPV